MPKKLNKFQELYWGKECFTDVKKDDGIRCEHRTMCATFKKMLKSELCTPEIKVTIRDCVRSHKSAEKGDFIKDKVFTENFTGSI